MELKAYIKTAITDITDAVSELHSETGNGFPDRKDNDNMATVNFKFCFYEQGRHSI